MFNIPFVPRATALAAATFAWSLSATAPAIAGPYQLSTGVPAPQCGPATVGTTLADYQATGSQGCMVGQATFYQFSQAYEYVNGNSTTNNTLAQSITVLPGNIPSASTLRFSSALFNNTLDLNDSYDFYFEYYIDPPIGILGFTLSDAPFAGGSYAEAAVCAGGTFNNSLMNGYVPGYGGGEGAPTFTGGEGYYYSPEDTCSSLEPADFGYERSLATNASASQVDTAEYSYYYIDSSTPDSKTFANPAEFTDVMIHLHIGPGGLITDVGTGATVPEPGIWTLTGLGGLVMAGTWRRKRRQPTATATA